MNFWCSATGEPWSWQWQPYLGVWAFLLAVLALYAAAWRRLAPTAAEADEEGWRRKWFVAGVVVLWLVLDWPVGLLGSGYLASVKMLQFLMITLVAVPMLLRGLPPWMARAIAPGGWRLRALRGLTQPIVALLMFNAVILITHAPIVVDPMQRSELGSFAIDLAWMLGAVIFWLPVVGAHPDLPRLTRPLQMAYVFAQSILPTIPASFLTFADFPLYPVYELAPRLEDLRIGALTDQRTAGLLMKIVGGFLLWGRIAVTWFQWAASDEEPVVT